MTEQELRELVAFGVESPGIELKGPGKRTDKAFLAKVVRAVIAMANRRAGGVVFLGVASDGKIVGLSDEEMATWSHDDLTASIAEYADPFVEIESETVTVDTSTVLVLHVAEFETSPVLCKKDFSKKEGIVLRRGACYVRPRGKPESVEIPNHVEMRELLELATEKGVRHFLTRSQRAGLTISTGEVGRVWEERRQALQQDPVAQIVTSRGYWRFGICPQHLGGDLRAPDLPALMSRWSVSLGGDIFPFVSQREAPQYGSDWAGFARNSGAFKQVCRLHTDGIFIGIVAFPHDWVADRDRWLYGPEDDQEPPKTMFITRAMRDVGRFFSFAANYAHSEFAKSGVTVTVGASPLGGRELLMDDPQRGSLHYPRTTTADRLQWEQNFDPGALTADARKLTLAVVRELFAFFEFRPEETILEDLYEKNLFSS
ncbi:MAG: ATP-binding protein [Planctomycetota bacterium]